MIRVSLKGLAARPIRAVLTALAIVLGVAMVSGSFVVTDTITKAFDTIFTSSYAHTDAVVSRKSLVDYSNSGNAHGSAEPAREDPKRCPRSGRPPARSSTSTTTPTNAKLIDRDGKAIDAERQPDLRLRRRSLEAALQPAAPRGGTLGARAGMRS